MYRSHVQLPSKPDKVMENFVAIVVHVFIKYVATVRLLRVIFYPNIEMYCETNAVVLSKYSLSFTCMRILY